jgi:serine/threonine protein kinase
MSETYRKGSPLGRGPFATVYEGRDLSLDRPVAIKELAEPFASAAATVRAFVDRARAMAAVKHANLRTLHAIDTSHDAPWLVTELADRTLRDDPARGPMQPEQVEQLLRQVLPALGAVHAAGLTHGGIKPSNLFVCDRAYKLGDFGFTSAEGDLTEDELIPPRYTAPEEITSRGPRTGTADLYSLGLVCYELLLGEERFTSAVRECVGNTTRGGAPEATGDGPGGELELWLRFHGASANLPPPRVLDARIPERLSRVVERMVRKDSSARYASCDAVLGDLLGKNDETPTVSVPVPPRRRRTLALAVAASLALTLLLVMLLLMRGRDPMVDVTSNPPGAQILYAGETVGTTPARLRIKAGTTLTLRKEEFRDAEVTFANPSRKVLHAELVPKAVAVTSDPAGATILVAGRELGVTPLDYAGESGAALTFHKEGYTDRTATVARGQRELHVELERVPDPWSAAWITEPAALALELLRLRSNDGSLTLSFASPPPPSRLPLETVLRFRAVSAHAGSLVFFALSSDGTILCVYPSRSRSAVPLAAGAEVALPLADDERAGLILQASEPLGRDVVFALVSKTSLPPPPVGDTTQEWLSVYRFVPGTDNSALAFGRWVAAARHQPDTALAALEMEVVK